MFVLAALLLAFDVAFVPRLELNLPAYAKVQDIHPPSESLDSLRKPPVSPHLDLNASQHLSVSSNTGSEALIWLCLIAIQNPVYTKAS